MQTYLCTSLYFFFRMFNLILFGPPGSGKGTQSENIIAKYGLVHISTGNLLRAQISAGTPLGLEAQSIMEKGQLVPDNVVIGMINDVITYNSDAKGFLFDGFPRTVAQAEALDQLLAGNGEKVNLLVSLVVDEEELVKRLLNRGLTSGRSDDRDEAVVRDRIEEYRKKTTAVAEYYRKFGKVDEIIGTGSVEDIFRNICQSIDKH